MITVSCFLIAVLHRAFGVLGHVQKIIGAHDDDISAVLSVLPEALENINDLAASLKDTADQTGSAIHFVQNELEGDVRTGLETFAVYARIISSVFQAVFSKSA